MKTETKKWLEASLVVAFLWALGFVATIAIFVINNDPLWTITFWLAILPVSFCVFFFLGLLFGL